MIQVVKITKAEDLQKAFAIRDKVFVQGQNVPAHLEHEHDDVAHHFLAILDNEPVGAARWRKTENGYKLERFAVLDKARGRGIAKAMIAAVLNDIPEEANYIYLNAQLDAVPVYEKSGFVKEGPMFEEAGIQHFKMVLQS
ncbi:GNAT family N-acetyltransferase [Taibaiella lutea]|uniref:GNAT family N-acetyltransferase n=1 Tax=Taibaiella lutea TaxID=2608001 RepID=A0A5M6CR50_9BACT|nr:GNAT family N-acetyltransferase [Taibaiella lutea]KAA5537446.1 GNAT family N-acetyltransferase [Taibaiella lutea]